MRTWLFGLVVFSTVFLSLPPAFAADGTWKVDADGDWGTAGNWVGNMIADGATFTADFSAVTLTADRTVSLDTARTIGTLDFGVDFAGAGATDYSWILVNCGAADILTMDNGAASPIITVADRGDGYAEIDLALAGTNGFTKSGAGTLILGGTNTYTGDVTVNSGVLQVGVGGTTGNLGTGDVTNNATLSFFRSDDLTVSNVISGTGGLIKQGAGTLTLSGANTYSGGTQIQTGTVVVSDPEALGCGNVDNFATLDIGTTNLDVEGTYAQAAASTLKLTVNGPSSSGKVLACDAVLDPASTVAVNVDNNVYIPSGATFKVVDTGGAGIGNVPATITSSNSHVTFTASGASNDLILTASRSANGFSSLAQDSNAGAVGTVLDNITDPSGDMTAVLNTLEGLSNDQAAAALDTMVPAVDAGVFNNSSAMLDNFIGVSIERVKDVLRLAQNNADNAKTGFSAGDEELLNGIWGKGYGSYLSQGKRKGIQGYDAWNSGTALGIDRLFADVATVGISGGYAYGNVDSDANNASTYINSAQTTLYAGYRNETYPFYVDASGSFAWNWYNGTRDIAVGAIQRTANASYDGQQYGACIDGGYDIDIYKEMKFTPLLSLQWTHLHLQSYTETEAGALNLKVKSQDYDILQSGLGASVSSPIDLKWSTLTAEAHGKWLYDFIGDKVVSTSAFTGGGGAFKAEGVRPAVSSFNIGGKLGVDLKNNFSILMECDTELKDEFWGIYGAATVRYSF